MRHLFKARTGTSHLFPEGCFADAALLKEPSNGNQSCIASTKLSPGWFIAIGGEKLDHSKQRNVKIVILRFWALLLFFSCCVFVIVKTEVVALKFTDAMSSQSTYRIKRHNITDEPRTKFATLPGNVEGQLSNLKNSSLRTFDPYNSGSEVVDRNDAPTTPLRLSRTGPRFLYNYIPSDGSKYFLYVPSGKFIHGASIQITLFS